MSEPTNGQPLPDYTPEEKAAISAEMKKKFTVEDLLGYVNDEDEKVPLDEVIAKAEEIIRRTKARKQGADQ
jgi:hypothetical protein